MISIKQYAACDKECWDQFIDNAKNGHFMFKRDYMEYHGDRFKDHSLLFEEKGKLVAVMPANQVNDRLYSHGGLTFGGIVSSSKMRIKRMLAIFTALKEYAGSSHLTHLNYKTIPHIYSLTPAEEDLYALFVNNACLTRRDVSTTIALDNRIAYSHGHKINITKAKREAVKIVEAKDFSEYWLLLNQVLQGRHGVNAVHTLDEIMILTDSFPDNIRLFEARSSSGDLLAGALLYISTKVVHTQYLANSDQGRLVGALDFLIDNLLDYYTDKHYFDFGISTLDQGRILNEGLAGQKEGFGGRAIVHDFYELNFG